MQSAWKHPHQSSTITGNNMKIALNKSTGAVVVLSLLLPFTATAQNSDWKLKKNRKGIQVFTRDIPGSNFKEFKAVCDVDASMPGVLKLMEDISSYPQWFPNLKESRLIKMISSREMILYHMIKLPFPADDRDSVFKVTASRDLRTSAVTLRLNSLYGFLPEREKTVRVKDISGSWTFIPDTARGTIKVIYQMHSDPGGNLTPLMANMAVVKRPFTVLKNMKEMLKKSIYKNANESDVHLLK